MANIPSSEKRNRQRLKRRQRNLMHLTPMRTFLKRARATLDDPKVEPAEIKSDVSDAIQRIAHAAQKGVVHKKTAARKISRLTKARNKALNNPPAASSKPAAK